MQEIIKKINFIHLSKLKNLDHKNPKVFVLFSGVTGSGKSYIAEKLEERFGGIRINNDEIRDIIRDHILPSNQMTPDEQQALLKSYLKYLFDNLPKENGFIILDSSMDRDLKKVEAVVSTYNYQTFRIRIDLPREILVSQIKMRSESDAGPYLKDLDRHIADHERISPEFHPDFKITERNFNKFEELFRSLREKIGG